MALPTFPTFIEKPSEERLEREVERLMDRADAALMDGRATQPEYDSWTKALDRWADSFHR
jgi:hypothetical protein